MTSNDRLTPRTRQTSTTRWAFLLSLALIVIPVLAKSWPV